ARRSNRRAILNWATGITLVWGLYMTIWLPYLDSRRSYRPVAESLATELRPHACVASAYLGEPQRALFHYFAGLVTVRLEMTSRNDCDTLLVQYTRHDEEPFIPLEWQPTWVG